MFRPAKSEHVPVLVVRVAVSQETCDRFRYFLVGEDIPQTISSQHQNVISSMLIVHQRVDFDLKVKETGKGLTTNGLQELFAPVA